MLNLECTAVCKFETVHSRELDAPISFYKIVSFLVQFRPFTIQLQKFTITLPLIFLLCFCHCWHSNIWVIINAQFVRFLGLCSISDLEENPSNLSKNLNTSYISRNYFSGVIYHSMHKIHKNGKLLLLDWPYFINKDYKVLVNWDLKVILIMFNTLICIIWF